MYNKEELRDALMQIACAIRDIKEHECQNSGLNWMDNFSEHSFFCNHKWHGQQVGGSPDNADSTEWVCYCKECGIEKNDDFN